MSLSIYVNTGGGGGGGAAARIGITTFLDKVYFYASNYTKSPSYHSSLYFNIPTIYTS